MQTSQVWERENTEEGRHKGPHKVVVRAERGEDHLQQQHANAEHVETVWVVQAPQDGRQRCRDRHLPQQ